MAAAEQNYRNQYTLDIVFGVSCLAMLGAVGVMFAQDYYGPWKPEQRVFRDVESEMAMRTALEQMPSVDKVTAAEEAVKKAREKRDDAKIADLRSKVGAALPTKQMAEDRYQNVKAVLESRVSFYNQAIDHQNKDLADQYDKEVKRLTDELKTAQVERDKYVGEYQTAQNLLLEEEKELNTAVADLKKMNEKFDAQVRLALKMQWSFSDRFRALPILDAFASPYKIHQYTINDIPIDYNFKYVTRYDRCVTCHQGIDQPSFTKEQLASLREDIPASLQKDLENARALLEKRHQVLAGLPEAKTMPSPGDLELTKIPPSRLTDSRITEFAAHPRLDMFVGGKSKHPAEKFGCTSCHAGQGSATSFVLASHTPNDAEQKKRWITEHGWHYDTTHGDFLWDFPMLPHRFIESSCLKCHHQVTDLIGSDNRNEAPKVLRGYNLIKENGCFGCHEISGRKGGRSVGPDLRLEPYPPRHPDLTPAEVKKLDADPDKAPGTLRKVGPSLFRLKEKTNLDWTAKWIRAPREFRPETKMPHFYGLSNNDPTLKDVLPQEQKAFPDAEIHAIAAYLFRASDDFLDSKELFDLQELKKQTGKLSEKQEKQLEALRKKAPSTAELWELQDLKQRTGKLSPEQEERVRELQQRVPYDVFDRNRLRKVHVPLDFSQKVKPGDAERGRFLFTVKGCLACHSHQGVEKSTGDPKKDTYLPGIIGEAQFGPDLTQVAAKLGFGATPPDRQNSARIWLRQWITDPHVHSPRTRMPITTHLPFTPGQINEEEAAKRSDQEAADIAEWLLAQNPDPGFGPKWQDAAFFGKVQKPPELDTLKALARVNLVRMLPGKAIEALEEGVDIRGEFGVFFNAMPEEEKALATDLSRILKDVEGKAQRHQERLIQYVGKKAINRLGCFACHDIPGFEQAKPIGVNLQDWGKKDPERLAFEDIKEYVNLNYHVVPGLIDKKTGKAYVPVVKDGKTKMPYEKFYHDLLFGHQREGYLNQKILNPRSYDFKRQRAWDDLARMPEFRFARSRRHEDESDQAYEDRQWQEEAEAREAVMTFILGLVAEPVPEKSINRPSGDREVEVKGRQILDKYNCAGCHVIRPGVLEFKMDAQVSASLKDLYKTEERGWVRDHLFGGHKNWAGKPQASPDRVIIHGLPGREVEQDEDDPKLKLVKIRLTQALTFGPDGAYTIRANPLLKLPTSGLVYPPRSIAEDPARYQAFLRDQGAYGGAFTDVFVKFLVDRDAKRQTPIFKEVNGVSSSGLSAAPPLLIGQGERTRENWLKDFLQNPQQIRRMTEFPFGGDKGTLRMPKFNMSPDEAQALVDYFAAVERLTNPGTGLTEPFETGQPVEGFESPYWRHRNQEYVQRLKQTTMDTDGKPITNREGKPVSMYKQRIQELEPLWRQEVEKRKQVEKELADALKSWQEAKKKDDQKSTEQTKSELEAAKVRWQGKVELLETLKLATLEEQERAWSEREAYATDGFRIVGSPKVCMECHQVGSNQPSSDNKGPPLSLAAQRLRPGWTERWLANPARMIYYTPMPQNFPPGADTFKFFASSSLKDASRQQLTAGRDILMMYPQASALQVNRYWLLPLPGEKK